LQDERMEGWKDFPIAFVIPENSRKNKPFVRSPPAPFHGGRNDGEKGEDLTGALLLARAPCSIR
jgi:hypothetical protein